MNLGAAAPRRWRYWSVVAAFLDDGEEAGVFLPHGAGGGFDVLGVFDHGGAGDGVVGETDPGAGAGLGADGFDGETVAEDGEVRDLGEGGGIELETGGMDAVAVAEIDEGLDLVHGHEVLDAIGELAGGIAGVVGEGVGGIAALPAALVLELLGKIPVVESTEGLDAGCEELVEHAVVEVEALGIGCAGAIGEDARPGDGEAVGFDAERLHQGDVGFVTMVVIIGDVAGIAIVGLAGGMGEGVPDGDAAAVFLHRAFDLVGGSGRTPKEALRERAALVRRSGQGFGRGNGGHGRGAGGGCEKAGESSSGD